jgi:hypothetical protein
MPVCIARFCSNPFLVAHCTNFHLAYPPDGSVPNWNPLISLYYHCSCCNVRAAENIPFFSSDTLSDIYAIPSHGPYVVEVIILRHLPRISIRGSRFRPFNGPTCKAGYTAFMEKSHQ